MDCASLIEVWPHPDHTLDHVPRGSIVGQCQYSWRADQNNLQIWAARHDQWLTRECTSNYERCVVYDGEASTWCPPRGTDKNAQAIATIMSGHCATYDKEEHTHHSPGSAAYDWRG